MANSLLSTLQDSYPDFTFRPGNKFLFHPPKTILFDTSDPNFDSLILHELGHALLNHRTFRTDIERLKMERAAWEKAAEVAHSLSLTINEDLIEEELDSYRNWLHIKSKCKKCGLTRYQTPDGIYHCPKCEP